ncbi:acyltransferase family protein [Hyphomonas sp.]|uniref:acyltransferase family protein n=1 Tax=Hyphomonas sp. TaxID=87 RepID=UPI003528D2B2
MQGVPPRNSLKFRHDINGLRAWAVVAVILYHFGVAGFASGFVGVDIFFVISGYLMTQIIVEGVERRSGGGGFSVLGFYLARAKRIIPALAVVAIALLIMGWSTFSLEEFRSLGSEVLFAMLFLSNYKYWHSYEGVGGYFAEPETPRWLLHSWSLSVEWQFYLILPILILFAWRLRPNRKFLAAAFVVVATLSFAASVFETQRDAELAFYSLHTRAWEMLAGGMVFLFRTWIPAPERRASMVEGLGFVLVLLAIFIPHPETQWPGYRAVLPVLGAVLILWANRQDSLWTNTPIAQFFGNTSYSLYLWHWPIVVALEYIGEAHSYVWICCGLVLTIFLSMLSYKYIEQTTRSRIGRGPIIAGLAVMAVVVSVPACAGFVVRYVDFIGVRELSPQIQSILATEMHVRSRECLRPAEIPSPMCTFGGETPGLILMGDSHGLAVVPAAQSALPNANLNVTTLITIGCALVRGAERTDFEFRCTDFVDWAMGEEAAMDPDLPVLVSTRTSSYLFGMNETKSSPGHPLVEFDGNSTLSSDAIRQEFRARQIESLCEISSRRKTYVLRPIPEMGVDIPTVLAHRRRFGVSDTAISISLDEYEARNQFVFEMLEEAAQKCNITTLDPVPYLCSAGRCWGTKDGYPLYKDDDHLSVRGSELLAPLLSEIFSEDEVSNAMVN